MSEMDLPNRLPDYGATHVELRRLTLRIEHCKRPDDGSEILPSFSATDKIKDRRYPWFGRTYGDRCWELDALDPRDLRNMVEQAIRTQIDWEAWNRWTTVQQAETESLKHVLDAWTTSETAWGDPAI